MRIPLPKYEEQVAINKQIAYERQTTSYKLSKWFNRVVNDYLELDKPFSKRGTDCMVLGIGVVIVAVLFTAILMIHG